MAAALREVKSTFRFHRRDCPTKEVVTSKYGSWNNVVQLGMKVADPTQHFEMKPVTVVDGRSHLPGGKEAWNLEEHGFCFIKTPDYDFEEHHVQNRRRVNKEFGPKVAEAVRVAAKAKKAFWMSHQRRAENGTVVEKYAKSFPHSDYGPEYEAQFRNVLEHRYGVPHEEAQTCGLVVMNMWCPVERPAYKFPLALLDASSVHMEKDTIRYQADESIDNGYGYYNGKDNSKSLTQNGENQTVETQKGPRPLAERVPQAAVDAPALAPLWASNHRYVYLPDMEPDEAAVFKQYDYRKSSNAKATFHCAVDDRFHEGWAECPGRRSIECRVILTYDSEEKPPNAKL